MPSRLRYLIGAANILLLAVQAAPNQYVLNVPQKLGPEPFLTGHLWRFDVGSDSEALSQVLASAKEYNLDLWQITNSHVDIYLPTSSPELPESLRAIPHSLSTNITAPGKSTTRGNSMEWNLTSLKDTTYHTKYHPLYEIENFMHDLQALHPDMVKINNLGHSGEGRELMTLSISKDIGEAGRWKGKAKKGKKKKEKHRDENAKLAFVILGAQHAREWIAISTALYLSHALVSNQTEPHSLAHLLDTFDFHIAPIPNPDGYDYTWETDRYWYKNRQRMGNKMRCFGLDMNRNWGYKWKQRADDTPYPTSLDNITLTNKAPPDPPVDPCSHWYPGHRPFQAPEVNNIANWIITIPNIVGFIDLRSYGQMLSSPFSYSCKNLPPDAEDQIEAGLGAAQAMKSIHGAAYITGRLCEMLYRAPGNVVDWMYKRAGIKYSYVLHLRDTGTYGFSLPAQWIRPVGEETGEMVTYLAKFIAKQLKRDF